MRQSTLTHEFLSKAAVQSAGSEGSIGSNGKWLWKVEILVESTWRNTLWKMVKSF